MTYSPIIPLLSGYDPDEVEYVEHSLRVRNDDGREEITKKKVPIVNDNSSDEDFLIMIYKFKRAAQALGWDTGELLLSKFEMSLEGAFQQSWTDILEEANPDAERDVPFFEEQLSNLIADRFDDEEWEGMVDYIRTIRKPMSLDAKQLLGRIRHMIQATQLLPNATTPIFTEDEVKRIYLKAFPMAWQVNFRNAGKSAAAENINAIQRYMSLQEKADPPRNRNIHDNNNENRNRNRRSRLPMRRNNNPVRNRARYQQQNNEPRQQTNTQRGRNFNTNRNNTARGSGPVRRIQDTDPCPLPGHAGHTWGMCYSNA
jgi:hypothetical protein